MTLSEGSEKWAAALHELASLATFYGTVCIPVSDIQDCIAVDSQVKA